MIIQWTGWYAVMLEGGSDPRETESTVVYPIEQDNVKTGRFRGAVPVGQNRFMRRGLQRSVAAVVAIIEEHLSWALKKHKLPKVS